MKKPNKEDIKYKIRTGNNLRVSYKTNWELFSKDLDKWIEEAISVTHCCTELKAVDITGIEDIPDPYWEEYIEGKKQ
jgi:hypothetical protein